MQLRKYMHAHFKIGGIVICFYGVDREILIRSGKIVLRYTCPKTEKIQPQAGKKILIITHESTSKLKI